jgi:hypothetical protein
MRTVFHHTDLARASLDAHEKTRKNNPEEAAGHLSQAAGHVSSAVRAFHIISPLPGGAEPIVKHVKDIADGYKFGEAQGKAVQTKQARPVRMKEIAEPKDSYVAPKEEAAPKHTTHLEEAKSRRSIKDREDLVAASMARAPKRPSLAGRSDAFNQGRGM